MVTNLEELVRRYVEDRDAVRAVFRWENDCMYPVSAQVFLAADRPVDRERLERCRDLVKSTTGIFSNFRGNVRLPLVCMLAAGDEPEARWARTQQTYARLKETFFGSEYLALAALFLSDGTQGEDGAARGRGLYQRMKKEHPFLTGPEDSVFALILAQSSRTDDELIEDMEASYRLLRERFPQGDGLQSASHVLALSEAAPAEKVRRLIALFDGILAAGGKYGKDRQLPILAALSLGPEDTDDLVRGLMDLDGLLSEEKGYKGLFGLDRRTRMMHAAMLLSLPDRGDGQQRVMNAAAQQATLAIIIAQQAVICAAVAASAASGAAAGSAH